MSVCFSLDRQFRCLPQEQDVPSEIIGESFHLQGRVSAPLPGQVQVRGRRGERRVSGLRH